MSTVSQPQATSTALTTSPKCFICQGGSKIAGTRNGYAYYRCQQCELLFVWPMVEDTSEIYGSGYFDGAVDGHGYTNYDQDKEPMIPVFQRYLDLVEQCQPPSRRLLDCGAATGFFIDLARQRGWSVAGVEISEHACQQGKNKGLDMFCGGIENYPAEPGSFGAVTMWDVIEHVPDPRAAIHRMAELLPSGGVLALNTPDSGSVLAKTLGVRWHLVVPPEHLVLFHRKSLRVLLEEAGFDVVLETCIGKTFTVPYILRTLWLWQRLQLWKTLSDGAKQSFLRDWGIPINLHDNVCMFARKR